MARFYGVVGYIVTEETSPGVWTERKIERPYFGDLIKRSSRYSPVQTLNDDITISQEVSILADPFAFQNFSRIRYVEFMRTKWKVTNVEIQYPRLILSVGGEYNTE